MEVLISGETILIAAIAVACTQALLVWRVAKIEKKLENGLLTRIESIEKNCIRHHPKD